MKVTYSYFDNEGYNKAVENAFKKYFQDPDIRKAERRKYSHNPRYQDSALVVTTLANNAVFRDDFDHEVLYRCIGTAVKDDKLHFTIIDEAGETKLLPADDCKIVRFPLGWKINHGTKMLMRSLGRAKHASELRKMESAARNSCMGNEGTVLNQWHEMFNEDLDSVKSTVELQVLEHIEDENSPWYRS